MSEKRVTQHYVCPLCGGENVGHDAWVVWNPGRSEYDVEAVYDTMFCLDCEQEVHARYEERPTVNDDIPVAPV